VVLLGVGSIRPARAQPPERVPPREELPPPGPPALATSPDRVVPTPTFDRVFRELISDRQLRAEMGKERPQGPPPPPEPEPGPGQPLVPRGWAPLSEIVEPGYVCYGRLYFDQINAERYGWDLGIFQPVISAGIFWADVIILPYKMGTEPCRKFECSAGYCLPGDPIPLILYPPELSLTGALTEAATIGVLAAIFP
jgi:hypothetical protein